MTMTEAPFSRVQLDRTFYKHLHNQYCMCIIMTDVSADQAGYQTGKPTSLLYWLDVLKLYLVLQSSFSAQL
jgi:hypothetical protein